MLADASEVGDDALVTGLDELWRRGFIRESARAQAADSYDFSHGRIREVIYGSLTPARRRHHHLRIARARAIGHPATLGTVLVFAALLALELDDEPAVREYAAALPTTWWSSTSSSATASPPRSPTRYWR